MRPLTPRQTEMANLALSGASNKQIAEQLGISVQTAKNHLHAIYVKLGVRNRVQLLVEMMKEKAA